MPLFSVRFKGMLAGTHRTRLTAAGVELQSSKPALQIGPIRTGQPIHTALVEADSVEEAVAKVMETLTPDDVNFSGWEGGPLED
jgi:hypothetical protein